MAASKQLSVTLLKLPQVMRVCAVALIIMQFKIFTSNDSLLNFNILDYDTVIGINDVKTTNVYFYARLANSIKVARRGYLQLLKFDVIATNVGGAFDGTKFIAPVNGAYQFMFNALAFQNISGGAVISNFRINWYKIKNNQWN